MDIYTCRAKSLGDGEWKHGYVGRNDYMTNKLFLFGVEMVIHEIDPDTICRYIGWNDRHGAPIFENDIVEFKVADISYKYLIWWNRESNLMTALDFETIFFNGTDYLDTKYLPYDNFCLMMHNPCGDYSDIKVIGNIFDNPELMENVIDLDWHGIEYGEF